MILRKLEAGALLTAALLAWSATVAPVHAQVTSADQICDADEDPCVIDRSVEVADGAELDFGNRTLQVVSPGELDTGTGVVSVKCGRFRADTGDNVALKVRGPSTQGSGIDGGTLDLEARRQCSGNADTFCFDHGGCDAGTCTARKCFADPGVSCSTDANCNLGPCIINPNIQAARCRLRPSQTCADDGDCVFGPCDDSATFCSQDTSRECTSSSECDDGLCTIGYGDIVVNGKIRAEGKAAGAVALIAADNIELNELVTLNASTAFEDGGILEITSHQGDILINGKLEGQGGGDSQGGDFAMSAARDIVIDNDIDINGGDFDGGFLDMQAGRDIIVTGGIAASSIKGEGFGGEIALLAGRDIQLPGSGTWATNGHESSESFCGEAGPQEIDAGRDVTIGPNMVLQANGPRPDCAGEEIIVEAERSAFIAGKLESRGQGTDGEGGPVEVNANESIIFTEDSIIDVRGGRSGGGSVDLLATRDLYFDGSMDASASGDGPGDAITLEAGGLISVGGDILMSGDVVGAGLNGTIDLDGGDVRLRSGSTVVNNGPQTRNFIRGHEFVTIEAGATMTADATTGQNDIEYRNAAAPPVINGVVSPTPIVTLRSGLLPGLYVCGNGIVETGETCDDGDRQGGDGCNSECQSEGCVAATPSYPAVPLCYDANDCTVDTCNGNSCSHVVNCDDGIACTADSCSGASCRHVANNGLCNDGNLCTDNFCSTSTGCIGTFNTNACNDSVNCTEDDVCDRGECVGESDCPAGRVCDIDLDVCIVESTTTTTTTLPGGAFCGNGAVEPPEQCDDGDSIWDTGEFCDATCTMVSCGDPDDSGSVAASDALFVLRTAVGLQGCDLCVCNVDSSSPAGVTAGDALRTLQNAVGVEVELICPACL